MTFMTMDRILLVLVTYRCLVLSLTLSQSSQGLRIGWIWHWIKNLLRCSSRMGRDAAAATATATPFSLLYEDKVLPVLQGERIKLSSATFKSPKLTASLSDLTFPSSSWIYTTNISKAEMLLQLLLLLLHFHYHMKIKCCPSCREKESNSHQPRLNPPN